MAQGFETRQVIDVAGPSGAANQPARQLGLVSVQAPRGGNMSQVGSGYRALAEIAKIGGKAFDGYLERKQEADTVKAHTAFMQGKTKEDLEKEGVNSTVMEAYQGLAIKDAYNKWMIQSKHNIEQRDYALAPEEFDAQLQEQFNELLDGIDPSDSTTRKLLVGMAADGMGKLTAMQMGAHLQFSENETVRNYTNLLVSEAQSGDLESLSEFVNEPADFAGVLSKESQLSAESSAIMSTLNEGDLTLFDAFGGIDGLRERGHPASRIDSIRGAYKAAQVIQEGQNVAYIERDVNRLKAQVKNNEISETEALESLEDMKDNWRLSDGYYRRVASSVSGILAQNQEDAEVRNTLNDPEFLQDVSDTVTKLEFGMIDTGQAMNEARELARKYSLPTKLLDDTLRQVRSASSKFEETKKSEIRQAIKNKQDQQKKEQRASSLLATDFANINEYSKEEQQLAMSMQRKTIINSIINDDTIEGEEQQYTDLVEKYTDFLRTAPVVDEELQQEIRLTSQSGPITNEGVLDKNHEQAYLFMKSMRKSGLSEATIKEYFGDSYDYMSVATDIGLQAMDPTGALSSAWTITKEETDSLQPPRADVKEMLNKWDHDSMFGFLYDTPREKFFDAMDPTIVSNMLGAKSDAQYDEVLSWQVKEAAKNTPELDQFLKRRLEHYSKAYPKAPASMVQNLAARDLGKWNYTLGSLVKPVKGVSLQEAMGLEDQPGTLVTNSALLSYLKKEGRTLFPPGSEQGDPWASWAEYLDSSLDHTEESLRQAIFDKKSPLAYVFGTLEEAQRIREDIPMVDVMLSPDNPSVIWVTMYADTAKEHPIGLPMPISAKKVGDYYKNLTTLEAYDDNLPRR